MMNELRFLDLFRHPSRFRENLPTIIANSRSRLYRLEYNFLRRFDIRYVIVRMKSQTMWVDLHDMVLGYYFFLYREYEPYESFLLESLLRPGMTVVDIGANTGYYTIKLARKTQRTGRVFAFEPDPTNFSLLKRNMKLNRFTNTVCEQAAVMDHAGEIDLYLCDINYGDHRSFPSNDDAVANKGSKRQSIKVPGVVLDSYLKAARVDLIKMDIQGAEVMALSGMMQTLSNPDIVLFCEFWPHGILESGFAPETFLEILHNLGLTLYEIDETARCLRPLDTNLTTRLLEASKIDFSTHVNLVCTRTDQVARFVEATTPDRSA